MRRQDLPSSYPRVPDRGCCAAHRSLAALLSGLYVGAKTFCARFCGNCNAFLLLLLLEPHVCPDDANAHHRRPNAGAVMGVARQDAAPAVTGHPWPNTALPASMPVDPLRRTSSRPPEGQADQKPVQKQDQLPAEAAYRPTCLAKHIALNRSASNRVSTKCVQHPTPA